MIEVSQLEIDTMTKIATMVKRVGSVLILKSNVMMLAGAWVGVISLERFKAKRRKCRNNRS